MKVCSALNTNCESDCRSKITIAGRSNNPEMSQELPMLQPILWVPPWNGFVVQVTVFANSSNYGKWKWDFAIFQVHTAFMITTEVFSWYLAASSGKHHISRIIRRNFSTEIYPCTLLTDVNLPYTKNIRSIIGRDSSVGTATRYGLDGPGIESRWGRNILRPSRPSLGPPSLIYNG